MSESTEREAPAAFYLPLGAAEDGAEHFLPTDYARSVWDVDMQHGSPPAALLVRSLERGIPRPDARLARVTVELLGPVPVTETRVTTRVVRPGRRVELVHAEMACRTPDGFRACATATAWRMVMSDTAEVQRSVGPPLHDRPAITSSGFQYFERHDGLTYIDAVEWEWLTIAGEAGPGRAWGRPKVPLIRGENPSAVENLFCVVDTANGIGATIDPTVWGFLNSELTVHLHRLPEDRRVGITAETSIGPDGIGACSATVYDERGPVARSGQSILVQRW